MSIRLEAVHEYGGLTLDQTRPLAEVATGYLAALRRDEGGGQCSTRHEFRTGHVPGRGANTLVGPSKCPCSPAGLAVRHGDGGGLIN
jgi:hypothetical protein